MLATHRVGSPLCAAALACLFGVACNLDGGVEITFLWPDEYNLSPLATEEIAEITLIRSAPGEPTTRTVRPMPRSAGQGVNMGRIEAGAGLRLAVELRSATQRLIGYGRSATAIDLEPGDVVDVPIHMRRPYVYLTGANGIISLDGTRDVLQPEYRTTIDAVASPVAAASTPDGAGLVVAASDDTGGWALYVLSTSNHEQIVRGPIGLAQKPSDLAISASGRYVVMGHEAFDGGVSVVDLEAEPGQEAVFLPLGSVGRVAIAPVVEGGDRERAFALIDRAFALIDGEVDCSSQGGSRIEAIDLEGPVTAREIVRFPGPVQDLATSPESEHVFVANRCDRRVERVHPDRPDDHLLFEDLADVTTVAVLDGRIWSVGTERVPADGDVRAYLVMTSMDLDGLGARSVPLPPLQERAASKQFTDEREEAIRQIEANDIMALDLAVLPGSDSLALITAGRFKAPERSLEVGGNVHLVLPALDIQNVEYVLVDPATATLIHRVRTSCLLEMTEGALVDDWACANADRQDTVDEDPYIPTSLWALYGGK